jgi:hypothetical protein
MAKLDKKTQKTVNDAESSGFTPLEPGAYHAKLRDVDTTREGPKGPYWSWEYEVIDEPYVGRRLWNNTSLSEAAAFKMKETFEAFGVDTSTDTDEMIGHVIKLLVSVRTIQSGPREGEESNQIDRIKPADEDVVAANDSSKTAAADLF